MSNNKGKVFILIFLIIFSLSLTAITFYFFQQERAKNNSMQEELDDLRTRQKVGEMKLDDALKKSSEIERQLRDANYQVEYLTKELEGQKASQDELLQEAEGLRKILQQKEEAEGSLRERLSQSQAKVEALEQQILQIDSEKTLLTDQLASLEEQRAAGGVELGEIVVGPQVAQQPLPSQEVVAAPPATIQRPQINVAEGQVLVVNKKYNFAVIDLGLREGVKFNDTFSVYQNENYIGDIRVEKVHESMSAAAFLSAGVRDRIKERDRVVPKK